MAQGRPDIPATLRREVLVEAGHRCAIPACRSIPVEVAHISRWAKEREHTFDNLIALCPTCHTRYDNGDIDRQSILRYKANLSVLNSRYGELERRCLQEMAVQKAPVGAALALPGGFEILMMNLVNDGLVAQRASGASMGTAGAMFPIAVHYVLTPAGHAFIQHWLAADPLD